ncbi:hypothetical protein [Streptomyces sp. NBC_00299]|nr:hypothetical protein [Streptomyces sp. NBC_00299]
MAVQVPIALDAQPVHPPRLGESTPDREAAEVDVPAPEAGGSMA